MSAGWTKIYPPGAFRGRDGWHLRGKDMYGRPIDGRLPPTVKTEAAAARLAQRLLRQSNSDPPPAAAEPAPVAGPDRSFKAAAHSYRVARRPSAAEWKRVERLIAEPTIGPAHVDELTTDQVARYATKAMPQNKPDTLNREIVTPYSSVLHYAAELKWCTKTVIRRFPEKEDEVRAVTAAAVDRMVAGADATGTYGKGAHARRDRQVAYKVAFLEFLRLRGTRITDVLGLQREMDLDLQAGLVRLTIGKRRDQVQWLPLSPKLVVLLANLAACAGGYVFPWRSKSSVYKWWKPLCKRLGITVTPHQFRHALGEEAMDAEIDVITLMGMGAWSSLNSARRYARVSKKRMADADAKRAAAAKPAVREMVAGDLEAPAADGNIVRMERKRA